MNLRKIASYIILAWLPLGSLELSSRDRGSSEVSDKVRLVESDAGAFPKEYPIYRASLDTSPAKISANPDTGNRGESAPGSGAPGGVNTNSSALIVISDVSKPKSKSARIVLPLEIDSNTLQRKRRRRRKRMDEGRKIAGNSSPKRSSKFVTDGEYGDDNDEDDEEDADINVVELDNDEGEEGNTTELGRYLGSPCEATCSSKLLHVFCDPNNRVCECEKKYPVRIGNGRGCAKPKQLGDQCFYAQTCSFSDPNAICMQINHNAICQCKPGFHSVAFRRGAKRSFCSEDQVVVSADLPTLLGVATGIAVLTGLICFVLKLFNSNRYPSRRHYENSNMAPPLLFSSDNQWINGIPLTVHGRPSSRTSSQRSTMNLAQYSRSKGVLVPASRAGAARAAAILLIPCHLQASKPSDTDVANRSRKDDSDAQENDKEHSHPGSRRPSISSIRSTTSSQRSMSYSARRFEQESQQKEQRAAMRAAREEAARLAAPPTPSPLSTDELIPANGKSEDDDPLGFCASNAKASSPRDGSISELSANLNSRATSGPRT